MARRNLTKAAVEGLSYDPLGPSRQVRWDGKVRGFGCRVTPAGGKQYVLSYRFNGRLRLMSLGPIDHFRTLDEAREKAARLLHELRHKGLDPLGSRERLSDAPSLEALWGRYTELRLADAAPHTQTVARSLWTRHIAPALAQFKPTQLQKSDLVRLHDKITRSAGEVTANRAIQRLRAFLNWARARDESLFPSDWKNPGEGVTLHRELPRTHVLDAGQMRALAESLGDEPNPWVRAFVLLLMLTGARKDEIRCLQWQTVDLDRRIATLPKTKNGKPMILQLPPIAVELLRELPAVADNPWVFPGRTSAQPMIEPRYAYKRALERAGLPVSTTFHDLRRSFGTALATQGASADLVAKALNNTTSIAARIYVQLASDVVRRMADANALAILPGQAQP